MNNRDKFYWNGIIDMLKETKELEKENKNPKKYNSKYRHFTFHYNFYEAMKLMDNNQCGVFIKAICNYIFNDIEPKFSDKQMQSYFNICKRKMDIGKVKSANGSKNGKVKKEKVRVIEKRKESNYI